jgi:hypothetical protein
MGVNAAKSVADAAADVSVVEKVKEEELDSRAAGVPLAVDDVSVSRRRPLDQLLICARSSFLVHTWK